MSPKPRRGPATKSPQDRRGTKSSKTDTKSTEIPKVNTTGTSSAVIATNETAASGKLKTPEHKSNKDLTASGNDTLLQGSVAAKSALYGSQKRSKHSASELVESRPPSTAATDPIESAESSSRPASISTHLDRWEAFMNQHVAVLDLRILAKDIRRRCLDGREKIRRLQERPIGTATEDSFVSEEEKATALFQATADLEGNEQRLDRMDGDLIDVEDAMAHAAPRRLKQMRRNLHLMLDKVLVDFTGDASLSGETDEDLNDALSSTAGEMTKKQDNINALEDEILDLRIRRNRLDLERMSKANDKGYYEEKGTRGGIVALQGIDGQLESKQRQLEVLEADMKLMRDQKMKDRDAPGPDIRALQLPIHARLTSTWDDPADTRVAPITIRPPLTITEPESSDYTSTARPTDKFYAPNRRPSLAMDSRQSSRPGSDTSAEIPRGEFTKDKGG